MRATELRERVEHVFADALIRTYQCDVLIDLYHALREIWRNLAQPCDQQVYMSKLGDALQQVKRACLRSQQHSQLLTADLKIIKEIEDQFALLESGQSPGEIEG